MLDRFNRFIVWGARDSLDSIRHVWRAYHQNALKLGVTSIWVDDRFPIALAPGDLVLAADVTGKNLTYAREVSYLLHNYDNEASPLCQALAETPERLLRLQVWTNDARGEVWDECRQFDREGRTLAMPWGSDLLAEEFLEPVFNPESRNVIFVGAVWSDQYQGIELGNEATIDELKLATAARNLTFVHRTHVPDSENVRLVREARLAPALAGAWQVEKSYLPCRGFKAAAYGALCVTNVPAMKRLLGAGAVEGESVEELVDEALSLGRGRYLSLVREQQRVVAKFTYRESIEAIERAFEEIAA